MPRAIVTSTYRYKHPPRKRKAVPLTGPAIVTRRSKAASASVPRGVKPGNDNRSVEQPVAIVTAKKPRSRKAVWADDGAEIPESVKAFLARVGPARRTIAPRHHGMTARPVPKRHWRSYGTEPLPTGREALEEPFRAFPSWFMRVTCDRCGQQRVFSETHSAQRDMLIRDIIARMRHDGCGGRAGKWSYSPASRPPAAGRCGGSC
jgi:hypothetical protein